MGIGDEIMGTRHAAELYKETGLPVRMLERHGYPCGHEVWMYNPKIININANYTGLSCSMAWNGLCRPYIIYNKSSIGHYLFNDNYRVKPGEIYLSDYEKEEAAKLDEYILIEPTVKGPLQTNKDWGSANWDRLSVLSKGKVPWLQLTYKSSLYKFPSAQVIRIRSLRQWLVYISRALAVVTTNGGLQHAAAAFGIPGVIIFSEYILPEVMSYEVHTNLSAGLLETSCGLNTPCRDCRAALDRISPADVLHALFDLKMRTN